MAIGVSRWVALVAVFGVVAGCGGGSDDAADSTANVEQASTPNDAAAAAPTPAPSPLADTQWTKCADENGVCTVPGTRNVRYGARDTYAFRTVTGSIACNNSVWGDPLVGVFKACEYASDSAPPPPPLNGGPLQGVPTAPVALHGTVGQTVMRAVALTNSGSAPLQLRVEGGDNASGVSTRASTLATGAALDLRAALACDRAQTKRVSYTLRTDSAAQPSATLAFDLTCTEPAVNYSGPITITRGGTYSGNWQSSDPSVPAVSIRTTEPVVIENCKVRGPGNLIASRFSASDGFPGVDVTVRNCVGVGNGSLDVARDNGHFFIGVWPRRVVIENNYFASTSGIWVIGDQQPGAISALRMVDNRVRNVTGGHNAVAITEVSGAPGTEVAWNEVINEPFVSYQEDVILTYRLVASAADPARVHSNFIDGAYSRNPRTDVSFGSGINAGDSSDSLTGNRFVHAYDNHVVRAVNAGMFIAAGSDNLLYGNRVLRSGRLADGSRINHSFTGIYVWDCCYNQVPSGVFRNNIARDNFSGYAAVQPAGDVTRWDYKLDNCATDAQGRSLCTGNTGPQGAVTSAMEDAERARWLDRVAARGLAIGPR